MQKPTHFPHPLASPARCARQHNGLVCVQRASRDKVWLLPRGTAQSLLLPFMTPCPLCRWILPFWREPFNSFMSYPAYHPLKDSPPAQTKVPPQGTKSLLESLTASHAEPVVLIAAVSQTDTPRTACMPKVLWSSRAREAARVFSSWTTRLRTPTVGAAQARNGGLL